MTEPTREWCAEELRDLREHRPPADDILPVPASTYESLLILADEALRLRGKTWLAIEMARLAREADERHCAVCGWLYIEPPIWIKGGCVPGKCAQMPQPKPEHFYAPERAARDRMKANA